VKLLRSTEGAALVEGTLMLPFFVLMLLALLFLYELHKGSSDVNRESRHDAWEAARTHCPADRGLDVRGVRRADHALDFVTRDNLRELGTLQDRIGAGWVHEQQDKRVEKGPFNGNPRGEMDVYCGADVTGATSDSELRWMVNRGFCRWTGLCAP